METWVWEGGRVDGSNFHDVDRSRINIFLCNDVYIIFYTSLQIPHPIYVTFCYLCVWCYCLSSLGCRGML